MLWQVQGASLSEQREQSNTDMNRRTAITYFQIRQVAQKEQALQKAAVIHTGQLFCSSESKQTNPSWKKWQWAKQAERAAREIGVVILNTFLYCIFHCWRVFTSFNCDAQPPIKDAVSAVTIPQQSMPPALLHLRLPKVTTDSEKVHPLAWICLVILQLNI